MQKMQQMKKMQKAQQTSSQANQTKPVQQPVRSMQSDAAKGKMQRPLRVSLTTPQGELLQYDLNTAKAIYINSQAVNVPINLNQVYYLQTEVNGEKKVQPHLMTSSNKFTDGNVYYCMVPMVLVSSTHPK